MNFVRKRWVQLYREKDRRDDRRAQVQGCAGAVGGAAGWYAAPKASADTAFLDTLYRDAAGKAGITYVDVWDGFVDEAGRFLQLGPDFEGQIRRLRSSDGVLLHQGRRAQARALCRARNQPAVGCAFRPIVLPSEPATPDAKARPDQPAPRPLAGPIVPLTSFSVGTDQLLGGPGAGPVAIDAKAAQLLIRGEPLATPPVAPTILLGRGAKLDAKGPRVRRQWHRHPLDANARAPAASLKPEKPRR